jgi:hypothetical protein
MADQTQIEDMGREAAAGESDDLDAKLDDILKQQFGDDFTADDLAQWRKDRKGWLKSHNKKNMDAATAKQEAEEARDKLLHSLAEAEKARSRDGDQEEEMTEEQFLQTLGLADGNDLLTGKQAFGLFSWAQNYMKASHMAVGDKFGEVQSDLDETKAQFSQIQEDLAQALTDVRVSELMEEYPYAEKKLIEHAIKELPPGEDFDEQLEAVAAESHRRVSKIAVQEGTKERTRRTSAKELMTMAAGGEGGSQVGENPPDLSTSEGLREFVRQTWEPPSDE